MGELLKGGLVHKEFKTGTVQLPLTVARELSGGAYINAAGNGGILASDTTPALTFSSGGTRASWVASNVDALSWQVEAPADFNGTSVTVKLLASMSATNDTPVIAISFIEGMSGSNLGGNTAAVSGTTPTLKSVTTTAATGGNQWNITLTPGTHGTDALRVDSVWIEYTRKF